jgi:DNA-binding transcriptional ArsR family regulator
MVQYSSDADHAFAALADPTRRGILLRLGQSPASVTDLAERFDMTLTGMKKHIAVLESAGLVATAKIGRVRECRLGTTDLRDIEAYVGQYRRTLEDRLNRLGAFLEHTQELP